MKRKMKLIYKILKWAECNADGHPQPSPEMDGYRDPEINYHVGLCLQAGYLEAEYRPVDQTYRIIKLTWEGHNELDRHRGRG